MPTTSTDLKGESQSNDHVYDHENDADGRGSDDHVHVHLVHVWHDADHGSDDGPGGEEPINVGG